MIKQVKYDVLYIGAMRVSGSVLVTPYSPDPGPIPGKPYKLDIGRLFTQQPDPEVQVVDERTLLIENAGRMEALVGVKRFLKLEEESIGGPDVRTVEHPTSWPIEADSELILDSEPSLTDHLPPK